MNSNNMCLLAGGGMQEPEMFDTTWIQVNIDHRFSGDNAAVICWKSLI